MQRTTTVQRNAEEGQGAVDTTGENSALLGGGEWQWFCDNNPLQVTVLYREKRDWYSKAVFQCLEGAQEGLPGISSCRRKGGERSCNKARASRRGSEL